VRRVRCRCPGRPTYLTLVALRLLELRTQCQQRGKRAVGLDIRLAARGCGSDGAWLLSFLIATAIASVFAALFIAAAFAALTLLTTSLWALARLRIHTAARPFIALLIAVAAFVPPTTIAVVAEAIRIRRLCGDWRLRRCDGFR
jgi:hypothetical protein